MQLKHSVQIHWDPNFEEMEPDIKTYRFATVAELNAFMEGVSAARDTCSQSVLFDSREQPPAADAIQIVCEDCASTDVLKDAYAEWDIIEQDWVLRAVYDDTICDHCGHENIAEEVDLADWLKSQEEGAIIE